MKKYAKEFKESSAPQRSLQWYKERAGIPSASSLGALFDTTNAGKPSARAKAYLKQLAYERKFNTTYEKFDTKAMQDGRYYEDFAKMVYAQETGNIVIEATSYISDWFIATPDAHVVERGGKHGLLECKVVGDKSFLEFIEESLPLDHELQTQGQMLASGLDWVDYIIVNIKTRAYYIRRVYRNNKIIKRIYERLHEPLGLPKLDFGDVKQFDENFLEDFRAKKIEGFIIETKKTPDRIIDLPF